MNRKEKEGKEFLSSLGKLFEICKKVMDAVYAKGGNDEDVRQLLSDNETVDNVAHLIMRPRFLKEGFPLQIQSDWPAEKYIPFFDQFGGKVDPQDSTWRVKEEISALNGKKTAEFYAQILHPNKKIEINQPKDLDSLYCEWNAIPVTPLELVTFGLTYPLEQRFYPICAPIYPFKMGSLLGNVPCYFLYCDRGKRVFSYMTANPWDANVRFLVK